MRTVACWIFEGKKIAKSPPQKKTFKKAKTIFFGQNYYGKRSPNYIYIKFQCDDMIKFPFYCSRFPCFARMKCSGTKKPNKEPYKM